MITFKHEGSFDNCERFLKLSSKFSPREILEKYAQMGVEALARNTPKDTGKTASSWSYSITGSKHAGQWEIVWKNSNRNKGVNIALILQYGHGTRQGGYVQGIDYINPSLKPIFDEFADLAFKEVTK